MTDRRDSSRDDPPPKKNKKTAPGICITIDRVETTNDTDITNVEDTFRNIECTVKSIKDPKKDMQHVIKEMQAIVTTEDDPSITFIVIFIREKRLKMHKHIIQMVNNKILAGLKTSKYLKDVRRLVVNHVWFKSEKKEDTTPTFREPTPEKPNEIHVISKVEGPDFQVIEGIKSSFVRSFCRVFLKDNVKRLSFLELVTLILKDRELGDYFKENTNGNHLETQTDPKEGPSGSRIKQKGQKKNVHDDVFEEAIFTTGIKETDVKLIPKEPAAESDSPNGHSPAQSPFQYQQSKFEDKRISKTSMVKLLSMKIESKEQKIPKQFILNCKYEMNLENRGFCVIINQSNDRAGSFVDEQRMTQLFKDELLFEIKVIHNKKHQEIKTEVKDIVKSISKEHQCIFVFLMAHGDMDKQTKIHSFCDVIGHYECSSYIFNEFTKCKALENKPKVFIIQTCFGGAAMKPGSTKGNGATPSETGNGQTKKDYVLRSSVPYVEMYSTDTAGSEGVHCVPVIQDAPDQRKLAPHEQSDTLWLHSTLGGFRSYRHMVKGTHLIRHIDSVFRERAARDDINQLMTYVTGLVSQEIVNKDERQQPIAKDNTLRSNLYLNPGYIQTPDARIPDNATRDTINGSVIWSAKTGYDRLLMVASESNKGVFNFKRLTVGANTEEKPLKKDDSTPDLKHVSSGVMIGTNKHLVVAHKDDNTRMVVFLFVSEHMDDTQEKYYTWSVGREWQVVKPIALCAINNDGFGILSEQPQDNKALFEAYHRKHFDVDAEAQFPQDDIQSELTLRVTYGNMSSRDQVVYNRTKILILCVNDCTVTQFDMAGKKEFVVGEPASFRETPESGKFFNPCSAFWSSVPDNNCTQLVVACCNAIHTADVKQDGGKYTVDFNKLTAVDKLDRIWYDEKDLLFLTDDFVDYTKVKVSTNKFDKIQTNKMEEINDGWLRQTIWETDDGELVIGGAQATDISVIDRQSLEVLFTINPMTHGTYGRITSGFCSGPKTHVIISGEDPDEVDNTKKNKKDSTTNGNGNGTNGNGHGYPTQWVVVLDENNKIKKVQRANHRKLDRHPVVMFPVDSNKYGVICKESGDKQYAIIELRDKKDHKLRRTLKVKHKDVHINDHACFDRTGNIYMSSFKHGLVNKFDRQGQILTVLDTIDVPQGAEPFSRLEQPYTLFLASDGHLVVQCCNAMYKYNDDTGKWKQISGFVGPAWDMCCVGGKLYTIYKKEFIPWEVDADPDSDPLQLTQN